MDRRVRTARLTRSRRAGRAERDELDRRRMRSRRRFSNRSAVHSARSSRAPWRRSSGSSSLRWSASRSAIPSIRTRSRASARTSTSSTRASRAGSTGSGERPMPRPTSSPRRASSSSRRLSDDPVGCGVLRFHDRHEGVPEWAELKRLWVATSMRGMGLGRRLLVDLERRAASAGAPVVRLDTNRVLTEAIADVPERRLPRDRAVQRQPVRPPLGSSSRSSPRRARPSAVGRLRLVRGRRVGGRLVSVTATQKALVAAGRTLRRLLLRPLLLLLGHLQLRVDVDSPTSCLPPVHPKTRTTSTRATRAFQAVVISCWAVK